MSKVAAATSKSAHQLLRFQQNNGYLNDVRLESFGFFLDDYVIYGGDLTFDTVDARKVLLSESIISLNDQLWRAFVQEFRMTRFNTTYYVGYVSEQGYVFGETEPFENYLRLWTIPIDANGNIGVLIDHRDLLGYVKFKARYDGVYLNTTEVEQAITNANNAVNNANEAAEDTRNAIVQAQQATDNANQAAHDANTSISAVNQALEHAEQAVDAATVAITNANEAVNNANNAANNANEAAEDAKDATTDAISATQSANNAADDANALNIALTQLKTELESLQSELEDIEQQETQRMSNESDRVTAENTRAVNEIDRADAETARRDNEAVRVLAEQARELAEQSRTITFGDTITAMLEIIEELDFKGEYINSVTYEPYNVVRLNKSSYVALQQVTGVTPIDDGVNWRILAVGGADGTGAVSSVNGELPDEHGNVQINIVSDVVNDLTSDATDQALSAAMGKLLKALIDTLDSDKADVSFVVTEVAREVAALVDSAPETLNTINALAEALGNDPNFATTIMAMLGEKASNAALTTTNNNLATTNNSLATTNNNLSSLEQTVTTHLDNYALMESQVTNHESRLNQLENGSTTVKADVTGLNREVAYLKLKQEASERIEGGTVFADDFKGSRFGFTLDEVNSSGFKIKNGKLVLVKDEAINYSFTDSIVRNYPLRTEGNGGRKLVRLKNGWLVSVTISGTSQFIFQKGVINPDKTIDWTSLCWISQNGITDIAIVSDGTTIHAIFGYSFSGVTKVVAIKFDATIVPNIQLSAQYLKDVDTNQIVISKVSLAIDTTNGHLYAAWASRNTGYSNSFNIRYSKSTDGGVTWSSVTQLTAQNTSGVHYNCPTIAIVNSTALIIVQHSSATERNIRCLNVNPVVNTLIFGTEIYNQSNPSAVVDKDGVIHVAWHGQDAQLNADIVRYSKSTDGGVTWSPMQRLSNVNQTLNYPSISVDNLNQVHIMASHHIPGNLVHFQLKESEWVRSDIDVDDETNKDMHPSTLADMSITITIPPVVYMGVSNVRFSGEWMDTEEVPTTNATAVYNIPPTNFVGTFLEKVGNLTVTAQLNDTPMDMKLEDNEYQFVGTLATEAPAKLKLQLERPNITNGENDAVTRILGGRS